MIGTRIGSYTLVRLLGAGGMGQVYLAEHAVLRSLHAIKILDPQLMQSPQLVARFVNEARAAATLHHPNLIRVHHIDQVPDGAWYMVLDYLEGGSLAQYLASLGGPVPAHDIVHVLAQVLSCMQHVHDHGVVHRDLKPDNLFLIQHEGEPRFVIVLDLGVAQLNDELAAGHATKTGTVIGTPVYMAPEQLKGERVTAAADTFAVGVIAYEMATGGWFPFQHDAETRAAFVELPAPEIYFRQRSEGPVDPRRRFSRISDALASVILRALDADPNNRFRSDRDFALALADAVPADGVNPQGLAIVRQVARTLIDRGDAVETLRATKLAAGSQNTESRYQIIERLGAGGMAEVFLASQIGAEGFARRVAIKRVLAGYSETPEFATMFVSEARLASKLSHPNIVSVLDFDKDAEGRLFLVMEYVHGRDLARLLDAGPLPPSLVIYVVTEILRGLSYAHLPDPSGAGGGLIHRDVSPQNVLVDYEGAVKVSDFGLAKALSASGKARSELIKGKPSYMSPEQCNGDALDPRSDLFSIGVMTWEMLTRQPLFTGTPKEVIAKVLFKVIPEPRAVYGRAPADVSAIAMRLVANHPDHRYPDAEAAIDDLLRCEDAPRDGRRELARLIGERFPDAQVRSRGGSGPAGGAPRGSDAPQITAPAPPSTLGDAGSPSPRWLARGVIGSLVVAAGVIAALAVTHARSSRSRMQVDVGTKVTTGTASDAASAHADASLIAAMPAVDAGAPADAGATVDASVSTHAHGSHPPPTPRAAHATGELAIYVKPWALIWLNGTSVGQTPYHEQLPVGPYRVRMKNEDAGKDETTTVTVTHDQTTTIQRTW